MTSFCLLEPGQAFAESVELEKKLNKLLAEIHTKGAIETPVLEELKKLVPELEQEGAGDLPALKDLKSLLLELEREREKK